MSKNPYTNKEKSLKYKSFALLYKEFTLPLMKFLIKRTGGDVMAAEETFSRTVEAGLKGYYTFESKSTYFTWICRIALNKLADYYREKVHERSRIIFPLFEGLGEINDGKLTPEEELAIKELRISVKECLNLLPAEKRRLLYMRYWEDLPLKVIAAQVGLSERAVEGKLYRARLEFKHLFLQKHPKMY